MCSRRLRRKATPSAFVTHDLIDAHGNGPQVQVVAIGTDGQLHPGEPSKSGRADKLTQLTIRFPNLAVKDVKAFRLQSRPYEWVEFRNVALQPKSSTGRSGAPGPGWFVVADGTTGEVFVISPRNARQSPRESDTKLPND